MLTQRIIEGLTEAFNDLMEAASMVNEQEGYDIVKRQFEDVNLDKIAERLYSITSATYITPNPEDFLQSVGFHVRLAEVRFLQSEYHGFCNKKKSDKDETRQFYSIEENPSKRHQVKLKLSLMDGEVGFGWSRKYSRFGTKNWGFFYISPKDSIEPSTVTLNVLGAEQPSQVVQEHMFPERQPVRNTITVQAVVHEVPKESQDNVNDLIKSLAERVIREVFEEEGL